MITKTLTSFPAYGFREDGRIVNLKTGLILRNKLQIKLLDRDGRRQSINTRRLFKELFPEKYGKPSSIKYLIRYNGDKEKDKGNSDSRPIIKVYIKKVIIRAPR